MTRNGVNGGWRHDDCVLIYNFSLIDLTGMLVKNASLSSERLGDANFREGAVMVKIKGGLTPFRSSTAVFWLCAVFLYCISLSVKASLLPFMSEMVSWDEEVELANGQLLSVHREVTYGPDEWGRSGKGQLKKQSITFFYNGEKVKWENNEKWPIHYMPDILDIVDNTPVLVLPVYRWGPCEKYDFPQEGLAAFAYRNGNWNRILLKELPTSLRVNLLVSTSSLQYGKEYKGKLITPQDKITLDANPGDTARHKQSILEISKRYAAYEDSCARIRPLPNPKLEELTEKNSEAETKALMLTAQVKRFSDSPQTISPGDFRTIKGKWTGSGYINAGCKDIIEDIKDIRQYRDGGGWYLVGFTLVLNNGNQIPIRQPGIKWGKAPPLALMAAVACDGNNIIAIRRPSKEQLIVHRFSQTGSLIDVFQVNLPDMSKFIPEGKWPEVWTVVGTRESLTITLGNYSYTNSPTLGGVFDQQVVYTVQFP